MYKIIKFAALFLLGFAFVSCSSSQRSKSSKPLSNYDQDTTGIRNTLMESVPRFRKCLPKTMTKEKFIVLNFLIEVDGTVSRASLKNNKKMTKQHRCIVSIVKTLRFNKLRTGQKMEVNQPLNLYPAPQ